MDVQFRSRRLERRYHQSGEAVRAWGEEAGRRYVQRINALRKAPAVVDLYGVRSLDFHPLRGDWAGQYALRLTGQMRLIVTIGDAEQVMVEEVVDYHG